MYKLSLIAAALLTAQSAGAAEVYKTDTSDVNLYGKVYAGHVYGDAQESATYGGNQFVRFGAKAKGDVNDSLKTFMRYEVQMYVGDSEKIVADNEKNLRVRLAYVGLEGDWGKLSFGRNYGAIGLVGGWTDQGLSDHFGQEALGVGSDTHGTSRSSNLLKYQGEFNGFEFNASAKLRHSAKENKSSYGAALAYNFDFGLSLGTGTTVEVSDLFDEDGEGRPEKPLIVVAGIKYELGGMYSAINYAHGENFRGTDIDHEGVEVALGYGFDNGISLMSMYNKGIAKAKGGEEYDFADSLTAGVKYQLNKQFSVLAEYRFVLLTDSEVPFKDGHFVNQDELALAAVYAF